MATELAKAYVQILPSAKGMTNKLKEEMGGPAEKAGSDAGARLGAAIKKAITAIGIGTAIKQAITEGMDLEQNLGGTEAVFGDFAASIQETAKTAYKNMGTSASEYMATANKMGALFQGSGLQQQESLDLTAKAMQRAADVASVMGIDTSMALESIAGAAKGNFTMMDNLGVAMNATTLQAYALEKGINFEWNTASNAEKAQLAMQMFFERTEQYAGNFARESEETLSGSMGAVKAALQDVLGNMALGENVAPSLAALKTTIINFANNLLPALANVITTLPAAAMQVVVAILPGLIETGIQAANGMLQGFAEAIPNVALNIALMIPHIVEAIAEGVPQLLEGGGSILNAILEGITQTMPILVAQLPMIVTAITECLSGSIDIILAAATQLFDAVVQAIPIIIPPLLEAIPEIIETIVSFLTSNVQTIVDAAVQMNYGIINAIPIIIDALVPELPHIIWTITEALIDAQPKILSAAVQALLSIIGAVPKVLGSLLDAMGSVGSNLVTKRQRHGQIVKSSVIRGLQSHYKSFFIRGFQLVKQSSELTEGTILGTQMGYYCFKGHLYCLGSQRSTVRKFDTIAQMEGVSLAVITDFPGFSQLALDLPVIIVAYQSVVKITTPESGTVSAGYHRRDDRIEAYRKVPILGDSD